MLQYSEAVAVSPQDRAAYLEFALQATARAGAATLPFFRAEAEAANKRQDGGYDPVTEADRAAEALIRDSLRQAWPAHGIYGEEFGLQEGNGLTWVIDPIDGTRGFLAGMLHWGVLLALFDGQAPVLGLMHQPFTGEFFYGDGERAFYRRGAGAAERRLRARPCPALERAVLACTGPFFAPGQEWDAFERVRQSVRFARYGGDCYHYAMLAMGYVDIAIEAGLKPYDIQAMMPIVRGAGGLVTSWTGGNPSLGGRILAAGDARVHAQAMRLLA